MTGMAAATVVKSSPGNSLSDSGASSPEESAAPYAVATQKRKGGRKPVYATQEERKMRNRAAQAAFRERRTEYIKHLEATIKHHEENLATLQQSSRSAADEVLMLRYKNSLLERILLEKRIDVHAELKAFTANDSPNSTMIPSLPPHPPHVQRALNQRRAFQHQFQNQHLHKQTSAPPSKRLRRVSESSFVTTTSPRLQISPQSNTEPLAISATTPLSPMQTDQPMSATEPQPRPLFPPQGNGLTSLSSFYASNYQAHMEKLDQEYEMLDGTDEPEDVTQEIPHTLHRPHYISRQRESSSGGTIAPSPASTSSASASVGQGPIKSGAGSTISAQSAAEMRASIAAQNTSDLQSFYNSGSWTVDLFSDPYLMGPLQFPNNFQTFPTSSMR